MINFLTTLSQAALILCVFAIPALAYWQGLRRGIVIIAKVELKEAHPDALTVPDVWRDYVTEVRHDVANSEYAYQYWRQINKLPDGTVTRELFRDEGYRKALRSQIN